MFLALHVYLIFSSLLCFENIRGKLLRKGKNMGTSEAEVKDSILQSSKIDVRKPDSRI